MYVHATNRFVPEEADSAIKMRRMTQLHRHRRIIRRLVLKMRSMSPIMLVLSPRSHPRKLTVPTARMFDVLLLFWYYRFLKVLQSRSFADSRYRNPSSILVTGPLRQIVTLRHLEQCVHIHGVITQLKIPGQHCRAAIYIVIVLGYVVVWFSAAEWFGVSAHMGFHRSFWKNKKKSMTQLEPGQQLWELQFTFFIFFDVRKYIYVKNNNVPFSSCNWNICIFLKTV